ncbi:MAG: pyridoxal phosphate-dependent aminotransferase [Acidobacteriota bacterium]
MPQQASMNRRRFAQILGAGAAYVAVRPQLTFARDAIADAQPATSSIVRLSSNENPYGPSPMALKVMTEAFNVACRYPDEYADVLTEQLAKLHGVTNDQILLGNGSGEILKLCAAAFTGPSSNDCDREIKLARPARSTPLSFKSGRGKLVVADPTFEAILNHATVSGAEVVKIPLTAGFSHDLPKMLAAAKEGLIYICNPNNPTASLTPKNELRDIIAKCPRETMILVDEAYHHYADSSDYESVVPLTKQHPNLIVARTFSKIYGMAGLRCGYCIAQAETVQRMRPHQTWDSVNVMAAVAAMASLSDAEHLTTGRRRNNETRAFVTTELEKRGYRHIPSQANFVMVDVKRPVLPLLGALRGRGVQVGRLFPTLPNHMRVTIGKRREMETFLAAFRQATA